MIIFLRCETSLKAYVIIYCKRIFNKQLEYRMNSHFKYMVSLKYDPDNRAFKYFSDLCETCTRTKYLVIPTDIYIFLNLF